VETIAKGRGVPSPNEKQLPLTNAKLCEPTGIAVDPDGRVYIADSGNHVIRVLEP
jgi:DNA-binding beta-propeller fold protein YncE